MKQAIRALATLALLGIAAVSVAAGNEGCRYQLQPGVTEVAVDPNQVVDVCLPSGQHVTEFSSGPLYGWDVAVNKESGRIMVRLSGDLSMDTNFITWSSADSRYEVQLKRARPSKIEPVTAGDGQAPSSAKFIVTQTSAPAFVPTDIWDDGRFTFIALPQAYRGALPAVFVLAEDGSPSIANFRWDEPNTRFVVQNVHQNIKLALGDQSVAVKRN